MLIAEEDSEISQPIPTYAQSHSEFKPVYREAFTPFNGSLRLFDLWPVIDERPKGPIERRKRNLAFFSPVPREERETGNSFHQFREGKENSKRICSTFERRKRNGFSMLKLQNEEKEKVKRISLFSRREREMLNTVPLF